MATELFKLQGIVEVITKGAVADITALQKNVGSLSIAMDNSLSRFSRLGNVLRDLSAPFADATAKAVDFEAAMRNANTIARQTEVEFEAVSQSVLGLAKEFNLATGPLENASALYDIYSAGIKDVGVAQDVLVQSSKAATAALSTTSKAADVITSVINAYGQEIMNAQRASDIMFKTVELGKVKFDQLANGLGRSLGMAANTGIEFEELGAIIATLTAKGTPAAQGMFAMSTLIRNLVAPTKQAQTEMLKYGISLDENTVKTHGVIGTLRILKEATGGTSEAFKRILTDARATNAALLLMADGGEVAANNLAAIRADTGATDRAVGEQSKSAKYQIDQMKASFEQLAITVGTMFIPPLKVLVSVITSVTDGFNSLATPIKAVVVGGATLTTVLVGLGLTFGTLMATMNMVVGTAGLLKAVNFAISVSTLGVGTAANMAGGAMGRLGVAMFATTAATPPLVGAATLTEMTLYRLNVALGVTMRLLGPIAIGLAAIAIVQNRMNKMHEDAAYRAEEQSKLYRSLAADIHKLNTVIVDADGKVSGNKVEDFLNNSVESMVLAGHTAQEYADQMAGLRAQMGNIRDAEEAGIVNADTAQKQIEKLASWQTILLGKRKEALSIEKPLRDERDKSIKSLNQEIVAALAARDQFKKDKQDGIFLDKTKELQALDSVISKLDEVQAKIKRMRELPGGKDALTSIPVAEVDSQLKDMSGQRRGLGLDAEKEVKTAAAKAAQEAGEREIAIIENQRLARKLSTEEAMAGFQQLITAKKVTADQEIQLTRKLANMTGELHDKAEKEKTKAKNEADAAKVKAEKKAEQVVKDRISEAVKATNAEASALKESVKGIQNRIKELVKSNGTEEEVNKLLEERVKLLTDIANKEAAAAKMAAKTGKERTAIEDKKNEEIKNINANGTADKESNADKIEKRDTDSANKTLELQNEVRDNQIDAMDTEVEELDKKGKLTTGKHKKILQTQLALRLENLNAEQQMALTTAQAEDATAQQTALIRQTFEQQKQAAIKETTAAVKALKDAEKDDTKNALNSTVRSFADVAAEGFTGLGKGFGTSSQGGSSAAISGLAGTTAGTTGSSSSGSAGSIKSPGAIPAGSIKEQTVNIRINVGGEIEVIDSGGLTASTANGIFSDLGIASSLQGTTAGNGLGDA